MEHAYQNAQNPVGFLFEHNVKSGPKIQPPTELGIEEEIYL